MSNTETQDDEELVEQGGVAALREALRKSQSQNSELGAIKLENLFLKAGIETDPEKNPVGSLLFKTWDGGEDIEVLKAMAVKVGAIKPAGTPADTKTPEELEAEAQQEAENERRQLTQDALNTGRPAAAPATGPHPIDQALEGFQENLKSGMDRDQAGDEAMAFVLGKGHAERDPRMIWDQDRHDVAALAADRAATRGSKPG